MGADDLPPGADADPPLQPPQGAPNDPWIGVTIGNYVVLGWLGQGAMGVVYLARSLSIERLVAIKLLPPEFAADSMYVERFMREAKAAAQLNHPNVITVYDAGCIDDTYYYLVMEYVEGRDLLSLVNEMKQITPAVAVPCIRQAASALSYAHKKNIIHRDIKPDNLMLTRNGVLKVGDLGLAKRLAEDADASLTQAFQVVGTATYMAPEQAKGLKNVDSRADIYSLGATFYHLLTGLPPYDGESPLAIMAEHVHAPVPDARKANSEVDRDLSAIIKKMMGKKPEERFQTMAEVEAALTDYEAGKKLPARAFSEMLSKLKDSLHGAPVLGAAQRDSWLRRNAILLAAAVIVVALCAVAGFYFRARPAQNQNQSAPVAALPVEGEPPKLEAIQGPPAPTIQPPEVALAQRLLIADFEHGEKSSLGGELKVVGSCRQSVSKSSGADGSGAWNLAYKLPTEQTGAWGFIELKGLDATGYKILRFRIKHKTWGSLTGGASIYVELSVTRQDGQWIRSRHIVNGIGEDWKLVEIPLADFKLPALGPLRRLSFGFDRRLTPIKEGWVFIDDIEMVQEAGAPVERQGKQSEPMAGGSAKIIASFEDSKRTWMNDMGGSVRTWDAPSNYPLGRCHMKRVEGVGVGGGAAWQLTYDLPKYGSLSGAEMDLRDTDAQPYDFLEFQIKRLSDAALVPVRAEVTINGGTETIPMPVPELRDGWQTVQVPLPKEQVRTVHQFKIIFQQTGGSTTTNGVLVDNVVLRSR